MARILLFLGWTGICLSWPAAGQDVAVTNGRVLKIPPAGGEPSFSFQISGEGRKGVVIVRDGRGTEIQTLVCPLLRDNPEPTQTELAAVREQFVAQFVVRDLDFDGHTDLAGIREFGAKWARYCVWLYDATHHLFVRDFLAEQMELLTNLKPHADGQISSSHTGPADPWLAVYRVAGTKGSRPERQLVPICSCLVESTPGGERPKAVVTTRYENGRAVVQREEAANIDMKAALAKCGVDNASGHHAAGPLSLNRTNNGQQFAAKIGQPIVVTLQAIGGGQYGVPKVSSPSIRFEGSSFPAEQNPGGPTQVYRFTAVAEGDAKIEILHSNGNADFTLTIRVPPN